VVGEAVQVVGTTWPLPPVLIVIESQNTSVMIRVPLTNIYEPLENLSLIVSAVSWRKFMILYKAIKTSYLLTLHSF